MRRGAIRDKKQNKTRSDTRQGAVRGTWIAYLSQVERKAGIRTSSQGGSPHVHYSHENAQSKSNQAMAYGYLYRHWKW